MSTAKIVNRIVKKFGPQVEFLDVDPVTVIIGQHTYLVEKDMSVRECDLDTTHDNDFSRHVQSILSGKVRNDEGVMA